MTDRFCRRGFLGISSAALAAAPAGAQRLTRPVRLGFVGVGDRGSYHLDIALGMDGIEVPAVCDINPAVLHRAKTWIEEAGKPSPKLYGKTRTDFERMCESEDLDCIICSTSWKWHAPTLLAAMRNGKNAVSEVPLIQTLDEAWEIVETHENLYPDHPTCRLMPVMDINHSDRFDFLVSMSSKAVMLNRYADLFYGPEHPYSTQEIRATTTARCSEPSKASSTRSTSTRTPRTRANSRGSKERRECSSTAAAYLLPTRGL